MGGTNWLQMLGWNEEQLEDLRFTGYSYIQQGHYKTALTFFEGLITLQPDSLYDLQTLGGLYLEEGNALQSLHYLDRALRIDPLHLETLLNRTKALFMLGYKKQAIAQAQELEKCKNSEIAKQANALLLTHKQ